MIKVALVRGRYLNNFEGQNYILSKKNIQLTAISSLKSLDDQFPFPVIRLPSLADLQNISLLNKPIKYLANRVIGDSQILFGLEKLAGKFDIFHTADPHYYYSYQLAKMRKKGLIRRLISTSWETIPFNNESVKKKKFIKKFTQKYVDLFICYTEKAKQCLIEEGIFKNKIRLVRLGVDLKRFKSQIVNHKSSIRQAQDPEFIEGQNQISNRKSIELLFVGRKVEEKGVFDLEKAFKKVKSSHSTSSGQAKLKTQSCNLKLKIVPGGSIDYQEMPRVYQEADIFVLPSKKTKTWEEQYGMVLIEAMASGLPIVAYNTGAIAELVEDAGLLVEENNIDQLASSIKQLIEDKDLRVKLGKIGRRRAEKYFDAKKTAQQLVKIYENISHHSY